MDFAGYKYLAILMVIAEIAVIFLTYKRKPRWAIYAILVSILVKGQYLWLGRAIYAWQIAALLGLVFLIARKAKVMMARQGRELGRFRASILLYFIYSFTVSIPMWLLFSAEGLGDVGTKISFSRVLTQTIYLLFIVGLFGIGLWAGRYLNSIKLLRAVILIATVVAYGAILQILVLRFVGINIFPIIGSDDTIRSAYIMQLVFRATSFVGEPKHLAIAMSTGLIFYFLSRLFHIPLGGHFSAHKPLAMLIALVLSLSTTGFALAAVGIGLAAVVFFRRLRGFEIAVAGVLAAIFLTQVIGVGAEFSAAMESQLSKHDLEVQDESVMRALIANPGLFLTGTGLGNIHLFSVEYLPPNFPLFKDTGYKANTGLFFVLGDSGLIGLLLLLSSPLFGVQAYLRFRKHLTPDQRIEALVALAIILLSLTTFLLRYDVLHFLLSGFVFARLSLLRTEAISKNNSGTARALHHNYGASLASMRTSR